MFILLYFVVEELNVAQLAQWWVLCCLTQSEFLIFVKAPVESKADLRSKIVAEFVVSKKDLSVTKFQRCYFSLEV